MRSGERNNGKNGRVLEIVGNNVLTVEVSVKEIFLLFVPVLLASKGLRGCLVGVDCLQTKTSATTRWVVA